MRHIEKKPYHIFFYICEKFQKTATLIQKMINRKKYNKENQKQREVYKNKRERATR